MAAHSQNLSFDRYISHHLFATAAVCRIADDGVGDMCHMNPNLMGAAGLDLNFEQSKLLVARGDFEGSVGRAAGAAAQDRHPGPIAAAAPDACLYFAARY